jgi:uncharacterized protein (DUF1697 family)
MPRYVAFLRAVNVGGRTIKMDRLRALFEEMRLKNVETFIASGNVLFDTTARDIGALECKIEKHLQKALGIEVITYVRAMSDLPDVLTSHPFSDVSAPHTLWVGFLKQPLDADAMRKMKSIATEHDKFHVHDREAYWLRHTKLSDPKLAGGALQKVLGAPTTFRNVTTIRRLAAKISSKTVT